MFDLSPVDPVTTEEGSRVRSKAVTQVQVRLTSGVHLRGTYDGNEHSGIPGISFVFRVLVDSTKGRVLVRFKPITSVRVR